MDDEDISGQRVPPHQRRHQAIQRGIHSRQPERLSSEHLKQMKDEDPADILIRLSKSNSGLSNLLRQESLSVETVKDILVVLGKACLCESMSAFLNQMITSIMATPFFSSTLVRLFNELNNKNGGDDGVVKSCLPLLTEILRRMPTQGFQPVQMVVVMVQVLWQKGGLRDEDLNKAMMDLNELIVRSQPPPPSTPQADFTYSQRNDQEPPESFRELPIIPRKGELTGNIEVFVLPNNVDSGFRDLEHYLECQFRLFRADVILPLKENIVNFRTVAGDTSVGYRVYTDVQIVRPVCTNNGLCYRIAFDTRPLKHVRWNYTRRLIFGSLVCLSFDNFVDSMLFATVDQREKDNLKNGLVDVQFLNDHEQIADISRDTRFSMVESSAYFEAYRHILTGMQVLNERNFPFQQYIVECRANVDEPLYLREQPQALYDLRPLMDDGYQITDDQDVTDQQFPAGSEIANRVKIQDITTWPIPEIFNLDPSQFEALRNALTREFTLIQGPPGTGKTYVGIKILKALLYNSEVWMQGRNTAPIVVVCYTNHALDQFLEGILTFFKGKLIRVGSRSKSDIIHEYSLLNARKRARELRAVPAHVHALKLETRRAMDMAKVDIHTVAAKIEVAEREIVHECILREFMTTDSAKMFPKDFVHPKCHIQVWLGVEKKLFDIEQQGKMYLRHRLEEGELEYEEDDTEQEETIALVENPRSQRQLLEDLFDIDEDFPDVSDGVRNLDMNVRSVRREAIGFDVTNLDKEQFFDQLPRELEEERRREKRRLKYGLIKRIRSTDRMTEVEAAHVTNIWRLRLDERWRLYRHWVDMLCRQAKGEIRDKENTYSRLATRFKQTCMQEDKVLLQNSSVVGMTTTAAARYQTVLSEIGPRIVVVEEAAEVLEAHVIGTLSRHCQHLILIGDHKQLRPNPTVHELAKKYKLEVSLFERMMNNGLHCDTLRWQHRMRPEIADVIRTIYPELKDHEMVMNYGNVKGIRNNLFFIDHTHPHTHDEENKSFYNEYEVQYLIELCRYMKKQGYSTSQITILTTYSSQMQLFKESMPKSEFDGVRVASVDSYQGEENDFVLLSLVRSADEGSIGFLKEENRICVALSRAKMGLYVIGNFRHITDHSSLMKEICTTAGQRGHFGSGLRLCCQSHPLDDGIVASQPRDFGKVPEGGCTKPCTHRLACGHRCTRMCHVSTNEHSDIQCTNQCIKKCQTCQKKHCSHACYKSCDPCPVLVEKTIPRCGHVQLMPGGEDERIYECQEECPTTLSCGHRCAGKCGRRHPPCQEMVTVEQACGHTVDVQCSLRESEPCTKPCEAELTCGHKCSGTCGTCHNGRLHKPCTSDCRRILICGHECQSSCSNCPPCTRQCENRCVHSECKRKCGEVCAPCAEPCQWKCRHHVCTTHCGDTCSRQRCSSYCKKTLVCGHSCIGVCGEPCPDRCRICDKEEVTTVFLGREDEPNALFIQLEDCKHVFEVNDLDQYMDGPSGLGRQDEVSPDNVVKIKVCPRCSTPIRRNLRYGNIIKQALFDIEKVKEKVSGCRARMVSLRTSIDKMTHRMSGSNQASVNQLLKSTPVPSETILTTQENQVRVFMQILGLERRVNESKGRVRIRNDAMFEPLCKDLRNFKHWAMLTRSCFSQQDIDDATREMERLSLLKYLIDAKDWIDLDKTDVQPRIMRALSAKIREMERPLLMNDEGLNEARSLKEEVKDFVPGSGIGVTNEERLMIVEAIGLNKGHWYKCRKGHVYAIGECGRAAEQASCPDCGGAIGGQSHELEGDNAWAPEMDDAEEPVWSEDRDYLYALQLQFEER